MSDTVKFVQAQKFTLSGSGVSSSATSVILSSMKHLDGSTTITMTNLGSTGWMTLEPGTTREEIISFTGITQNGDGTATLTGVTRGLKGYADYGVGSGLASAHAGGSIAILSNNPQLYDQAAFKGNDETITGVWTFDADNPPKGDATTAPTDDAQYANKKYVDDNDALAVHLAGAETITGVKTFTSTAKAKYDTHPTFSTDEEIIDKKYADDLAIAGSPDASSTVKGIVEEATDAEVAAGTAVGGTGARLYVNPSGLSNAAIDASTGSTDAAKLVKTDSNGYLDTTLTKGNILTVTAGEDLTAGNAVYVSDGTETSTFDDAATGSISQASYDTTQSLSGANWAGQTFLTPSVDVFLNSVVARYTDTANGSGWSSTGISIRATSAGLPTGADLTTASASGPGDGNTANLTFTFGTPYKLTANTTYAIIFKSPASAGEVHIDSTSPAYTDGQFVTSSDTGSSWSAVSGSDAFFTVNYTESRKSGRAYLTDANYSTVELTNFVGFVIDSASRAASVLIQTGGNFQGLSGLTAGKTYYLSDTAGAIGTSAGSNSKKVGLSVSATELVIKHDNS